MSTFVMLTRVAPTTVHSPEDLKQVESRVVGAVKQRCPEIEWKMSYAVMGPYDYVDIFEAPSLEAAAKVSMLFRTLGQVQTEIWPATAWDRFKQLIMDVRPSRARQPAKRASAKSRNRRAKPNGADRGVSLHDVAAALGDGEEDAIAAIMALNPTYEEFETALAWAQGESDLMGEERHPLDGKAKQIYDILTAEEAWQEEAEARRA